MVTEGASDYLHRVILFVFKVPHDITLQIFLSRDNEDRHITMHWVGGLAMAVVYLSSFTNYNRRDAEAADSCEPIVSGFQRFAD
jgi:hypothetical protein